MSICQITIRSVIFYCDLLKENNLKKLQFDFIDPDTMLRIPIFAENTNT